MKNALDRGLEMMHVPMGQLPPLALGFAKKLCDELGMCGEVLLTAWTVYAQEIEGLPCNDDLYTTRSEHKKWFLENKDKNWRLSTRDDGKITPVCD